MEKAGTKCLEWLSANEQELEKFAGQWIALLEKQGVISSGPTLEAALHKARLAKVSGSPYVFKVPSVRELDRLDVLPHFPAKSRGIAGPTVSGLRKGPQRG